MNEVIKFFVENWMIIIGVVAVAVLAVVAVWNFFKLPSKEQASKVKEWLLWAVTQAEMELGGGTGQLKLRQVYDMFVQRFPAVAKAISFDTFAFWVDQALIEMREMLGKNEAVKELVGGGENG